MMGGRWRRHWELFWAGERGVRGVGGIPLRLCERRGGRVRWLWEERVLSVMLAF